MTILRIYGFARALTSFANSVVREHIVDGLSLLKLLRYILCSNIWFILVNILCEHLMHIKNMYSKTFGVVFYKCQLYEVSREHCLYFLYLYSFSNSYWGRNDNILNYDMDLFIISISSVWFSSFPLKLCY